MGTFHRGEIEEGKVIYSAPTEVMKKAVWTCNGERKSVCALYVRKSDEELIESLRLHKQLSDDPQISRYIVLLLAYDSLPNKTLLYSPFQCTLEQFIEKRQNDVRNRAWFQSVGFPIIRNLLFTIYRLHRRRVTHGNISLRTVFFMDDRVLKLGDFRFSSSPPTSTSLVRDISQLSEVITHFCLNSSYTIGLRPGDPEARALILELHPRLWDTLAGFRNIEAGDAVRIFDGLRDGESIPMPPPRRSVGQSRIPSTQIQRGNNLQMILDRITETVNAVNWNENEARIMIEEFKRMLPAERQVSIVYQLG